MSKNLLPADNAHRRRAITELDSSFLVEAAAGTGKTTLLVSRVLEILRTGKATLPQIAAITFTEKAAGELKAKLRRGIQKALQSAGASDQARLRRALTDLESMTVATIHSFCADMLRERPVEAGVEPGFVIADELTTSLIREEAWEEWFTEELSRDNPVLRRAIEWGIRVEDSASAEAPLSALVRLLVDNPDLFPRAKMAPKWTIAQFAEAVENVRETVSRLLSQMTYCRNPNEDKAAEQIRQLAEWGQAPFGKSEEEIAEHVGQLPKINLKAGIQSNWSSKETLKAIKETFKEIRSSGKEVQAAQAHNILCDLVDWICPFLTRYEEAKRRRRALDFFDLLLLARAMLAKSRVAREHFKQAYRYLLVDEFQDTDPLQTEIVFFLSEQAGDFAATWEAVRLVPGKLFLVGDPKQSIYGFRRADLDLYGKVRNIMSEQITPLQVNFRTVPAVITEVNAVFEKLMTGPVNGRFEPTHVPLVPYRQSASPGCGVRILPPPPEASSEGWRIQQWRRHEAGCIAEFIRRVVQEKMEIWDQEAQAARPITYGDIAILFRKTTGLRELEEGLRAHEVPYQIAGGKQYYERLELQDLLALLRAVENPYDAMNVIGALRSPFFGHSDDDLVEHFAAGGSFNYIEGTPPGCGRLGNAFALLKKLHRRKQVAPVALILTEIFETTQAQQIYAIKPRGEQRVANLLKVRDTARALEEVEVISFGRFVRWMDKLADTQSEGESLLAEPGEDFVRLMTFHKAKGLEFPLVVLAHMETEGREMDKAILDRARLRLSLNFGEGKKTLDWEETAKARRERTSYEELRLLYVAMTRARDQLVLPLYWREPKAPQADEETAGGLLDYLALRYPLDEGQCASCEGTGAGLVETRGYDTGRKAQDNFQMKPSLSGDLPKEAQEYILHRESWIETQRDRVVALNKAKIITTATREVQSAEATKEAIPQEDSRARRFGSLTHSLMEKIDFAAVENLDALAAAEAVAFGLDIRAAKEAAAMVRETLALPLFTKRIAASKQVYREVPFTVSDRGRLTEGCCDIVFLEENDAVIVDYKTDKVNARDLPTHMKRYRPQAEIYFHAVAAALDMPVKEVIFLFLRNGVCFSWQPNMLSS